jgi:dihydropyrimidine dehydrogenase (NAD+) subunit PreA
VEFSQISRCLLCHDAPCTKVCPRVDPARILRAIRFENDLGADPALKDAHLSGMGGIETWRDAVEFLLLGAGSLQVTTAVMQYGYRIIDDLLSGLRIYMAQRGYNRISQMVGAAVENVVDLDDLERDTIVYPRFRRDRCVGCGRCYLSCRDGGH